LSNPETIVASYLDHIEDNAYIEAGLARYGAATLVQTAADLIGTLEPEAFNRAALFIRDVAIGIFPPEITQTFRAELPASGLFDALDCALRAPSFHLRSQAAFTFGKLSYPENAERLTRALEERRDMDPLLTPGLISEIRWLTCDKNAQWKCIQWLSEAPDEVCRWATLEVIGAADLSPSQLDALLTKLANDRSEFVRAEALTLMATIRSRTAANRENPKSRQARTLVAPDKPLAQPKAAQDLITFTDLSIRFWHYHGEADYTLSDLHAFLADHGRSADIATRLPL
jgi:hypothetical protein